MFGNTEALVEEARRLQTEHERISNAIVAQIADYKTKVQTRDEAQSRLNGEIADNALAGENGESTDLRRALAVAQHSADVSGERLRALRARLLDTLTRITSVIEKLGAQLPKAEETLTEDYRKEWQQANQTLLRLAARRRTLGAVGVIGPFDTQPVREPAVESLAEIAPVHAAWLSLRKAIRAVGGADGRLGELLSAVVAPPEGALQRVQRARAAVEAAESRAMQRRHDEKVRPVREQWAAEDLLSESERKESRRIEELRRASGAWPVGARE